MVMQINSIYAKHVKIFIQNLFRARYVNNESFIEISFDFYSYLFNWWFY
jgi:hypothetical protein